MIVFCSFVVLALNEGTQIMLTYVDILYTLNDKFCIEIVTFKDFNY